MFVDGKDESDGEELLDKQNNEACMEERSDLVAELVELTYEQQYVDTEDPEVLCTIYNMWAGGLLPAEHIREFNVKFARVHAGVSEADMHVLPKHLSLHDVQPTWSKADLVDMLRMLGVGYLTGMRKCHLWELLEPYQPRLLCFCPAAINIVDRYQRYVEKKNLVESLIRCSVPQFVSYDMYMYKTIHRQTVRPLEKFNNCARCVEAWYLLVSLVRDPYRDVSFTACHRTFGLTLHHLKNITKYRQQPTMDLYAGTECSSATGAVAYRHHRYSTQKYKPNMRLYKLADVLRMLIEEHGSWGRLMEHLKNISPPMDVPPVVGIGPFSKPSATLE